MAPGPEVPGGPFESKKKNSRIYFLKLEDYEESQEQTKPVGTRTVRVLGAHYFRGPITLGAHFRGRITLGPWGHFKEPTTLGGPRFMQN